MISTVHRLRIRHTIAFFGVFWLFSIYSGNSSAQQAGLIAPMSGQPIPTEVAVEYATIGAMSLPIRILGLNGNGAGPGGQVAYNQQIGRSNRTDISQIGKGNAAAVQIFGDGNLATIAQQGTNNIGQGAISGTANHFDLQQNGIGNQADLSVNTPAGANLQIRQDGNGNSVSSSVPGAANVVVNQVGSGLSVDVSQSGVPKSINIQQVRAR